jgi:hypothetical protein
LRFAEVDHGGEPRGRRSCLVEPSLFIFGSQRAWDARRSPHIPAKIKRPYTLKYQETYQCKTGQKQILSIHVHSPADVYSSPAQWTIRPVSVTGSPVRVNEKLTCAADGKRAS